MIRELENWLMDTVLGKAFVDNAWWAWPMAESLHFIGLTLLLGSIILIDLRLMGYARGIGFMALHRLLPLTITGFLINLCTGSLFLISSADQYLRNSAFHFKLLFLMLAALNIVLFYSTQFRRLRALPADAAMPLAAGVMGGVSLLCWIGVICAGRLLTFYRPWP